MPSLEGQDPEARTAKGKSETESRMDVPGSLQNLPWCGRGMRNLKPLREGGWASQNEAGVLGLLTTATLILPKASYPHWGMIWKPVLQAKVGFQILLLLLAIFFFFLISKGFIYF